MMLLHYPPRSLLGDYARGGLGTVLMATLWIVLPGAIHVHVIFGGLTLLFALFTIRTAWRQRVRYELQPEGLVQVWPQRRVLLWDRLDGLRLRYYSTRRNREGGWMTLTMRAGGVRCVIDSALDGFEQVAARAATCAERRGLRLDTATRANLDALALDRSAPATGTASYDPHTGVQGPDGRP